MSSRINDLIQFADTLQRRKVEDRRYQDQKNMQLAQIASVKDKEHKIIGSQHLLNNAMMKFNKSGWEDGIYKSSDVNSDDVLQEYLTDMDEKYGLAGDAIQVGEALSNQKSKQLVKDASELNLRIRTWDEQNKNKYTNMNPFDNYKLAQDRKTYLKSLNAEELYAKLYGSFGEAKTLEGTGLSPADFGKDASWFQKHPVLTGIGLGVGTVAAGVTAKYGGPKALNAIKSAFNLVGKGKVLTPEKVASVKQLMPNIKDPNARKVLDKIMNAQQAGDTKKAIKILERFNKKFPELNIVDDIVKGPPIKGTKPSSILRNAKKLLTSGVGSLAAGSAGFVAAEKLASSMGDALTGEENSKTGQVGGIVGGTAGAYAVPAMLKKVGSKINEKGASWALKKVMEKGGPTLAAKFAAKAGLSGMAGAFSGGVGTALTVGFLAADLAMIAQILSEDE